MKGDLGCTTWGPPPKKGPPAPPINSAPASTSYSISRMSLLFLYSYMSSSYSSSSFTTSSSSSTTFSTTSDDNLLSKHESPRILTWHIDTYFSLWLRLLPFRKTVRTRENEKVKNSLWFENKNVFLSLRPSYYQHTPPPFTTPPPTPPSSTSLYHKGTGAGLEQDRSLLCFANISPHSYELDENHPVKRFPHCIGQLWLVGLDVQNSRSYFKIILCCFLAMPNFIRIRWNTQNLKIFTILESHKCFQILFKNRPLSNGFFHGRSKSFLGASVRGSIKS